MKFIERYYRLLLLLLLAALLVVLYGYSQNGRYHYQRGAVLDTRTGEVTPAGSQSFRARH